MSRTLYGGQAVLEGVMMRGPRDFAVAVRSPAGPVVLHCEPLTGGVYANRFARLPLVRGAIALWDTLALGYRSLMFSANVALEPEDPSQKTEEQPTMPQGVMWGTAALSLAFAVGLFFVLPVVVVGFLDRYIGSAFLSNLVEKVIRLALILGYVGGIGLLPEVRRVYAYHGAEHKTVNAYEAGAPLEVESVRRFTTVHPRCGTTFLIVVVVVSFFLFAALGQPPLVLRILSRVLLLPVIAGLAYELIRLATRHYQHAFVRAILAPGLAVQKLTTREPDDSQLEVAIESLKAVLSAEAAREPVESPQGAPALSAAPAS